MDTGHHTFDTASAGADRLVLQHGSTPTMASTTGRALALLLAACGSWLAALPGTVSAATAGDPMTAVERALERARAQHDMMVAQWWPAGATLPEHHVITMKLGAYGDRDPQDGVLFGPLLQFRGMRDSDLSLADPSPIPAEAATLEGGGYVTLGSGPWSFSGRFTSALSEEYGSTVIDLAIQYRQIVSRKLLFTYGASTSWANDRHLQAYYRNDPAADSPSASWNRGEFKEIGIQFTAWYQFDEHWGLVGILDASRTLGTAATGSPGNGDAIGAGRQIRAGGALNYRF